jgi:hypothetical protein
MCVQIEVNISLSLQCNLPVLIMMHLVSDSLEMTAFFWSSYLQPNLKKYRILIVLLFIQFLTRKFIIIIIIIVINFIYPHLISTPMAIRIQNNKQRGKYSQG